MTQVNLTLDIDKLKEIVSQSGLNDVVKSAIILILNAYMERQRDQYIKANSYERTPDREDSRNGYYGRQLVIALGSITLRVPRTRSGEFSTDLFEKYARRDKALVLSIMEMVINGVSTRKVTKIMEELCGEKVSKSTVSNLTQALDPIVKKWANRPLNVQYFRYIFVDAMYVKVREHHKIVSKAVYIALGVNEQNKREIIGLKVAHAESETNWREFFESLKSRGLQSPKLVISDAHAGLKGAISKEFIGTSWQRCSVHLLRNIFKTLPRKDSEEARTLLKSIFRAPDITEARKLRDKFIKAYEDQKAYEKAISTLDEGFDDATQFYTEPVSYHISLRTTNVLERLNSEIRRRERVIRIFPNEQSAFRLIGAVLMDYEETLDQGDRHFLHDSDSK